jgi:hypothetical protein
MAGEKGELISLYKSDLLDAPTQERIIDKERNLEYPLDRISDMRALINYSPYYLRELAGCWKAVDLTITEAHRMSTTRLLRIHMCTLIALAVLRRLGWPIPAGGLDTSRALGRHLLCRLHDFPASERVPPAMGPLPISVAGSPAASIALRLQWALAELADRLAMGEHPLYCLAPVFDAGPSGPVLRRAFFYQRQPPGFPHRVVIGVGLDPACQLPKLSFFRGVLEHAVPSEARRHWEVAIDGRPVGTMSELAKLEAEVKARLAQVIAGERRERAAPVLEVRKVMLYSLEVCEAWAARHLRWKLPRDAYESVQANQICRQLEIGELDGRYGPSLLELTMSGLETSG